MSVRMIVVVLLGAWCTFAEANDVDLSAVKRAGQKQAAKEEQGQGEKRVEEPVVPPVAVGKFTVSVRKVADVSAMKMDMAFDMGQLAANQQGQGFGNRGGDGFSGTASGGGGGQFTKPNLGIALDIAPSPADGQVIVELSPKATAIDDLDRKMESTSAGPGRIHFREFEASAPGSQAIYFNLPPGKASKLKRLDGELLVSPGRVLTASFEGKKLNGRATVGVDGERFTLVAVKRNGDTVEVTADCPVCQNQAAAANPQERFQALVANRGAYSAEITDDQGEVHASAGGGSTGGGAAGQNGIGAGVPNRQRPASVTNTFRFSDFGPDRKIQAIRLRLMERTGPSKSTAFRIEDIPIR